MRRLLQAPRAWAALVAMACSLGGAVRLVWGASRSRFAIMIGIQVCVAAASAVQVLVGKSALTGAGVGSERASAAGGHGQLLRAVGPQIAILVGTLVLQRVASLGQMSTQSFLVYKVTKLADGRVMDAAGAAELRAFDTPDFFHGLERASNSVANRPVQTLNSLLAVARSLLLVIALSCALLVLQPLVWLFVIIASVPIWWLGTKAATDAYKTDVCFTDQNRLRTYLRTVLTGRAEAKELRAFGWTERIRRHYDSLYDGWITQQRRLARRRVKRMAISAVATGLLLCGTLMLLYIMVSTGRVGIAGAVATLYAAQQLQSRLVSLIVGFGVLRECSLFLADLDKFVEYAAKFKPPPGRLTDPGRCRELRAEGVSFSYPESDALALDDVSIQIREGELIALVGENGSGKTTLAKVLCHLFLPEKGRMLWNGVDTREYAPSAVRARVGAVFQDFARYRLSAADNVAMLIGDVASDAVKAGIVRAAVTADADSFISRLAQGYDTVLSSTFRGGTDVSNGQWQRIAVARALHLEPSIMILDEPTSSLDPIAEEALFEMMCLAKQRTVVVVSHRLSTVRAADRIYVMKSGRIVESGTHDELASRHSAYAQLFRLPHGALRGRPLGASV